MLKLRRPIGHLNFNMELPIGLLVGRNPNIDIVPRSLLAQMVPNILKILTTFLAATPMGYLVNSILTLFPAATPMGYLVNWDKNLAVMTGEHDTLTRFLATSVTAQIDRHGTD